MGAQMHVAMLAPPVTGHINPMLHLSLKLASHGVKVTFVNTEYNRSRMKLPFPISPATSSMEDDAQLYKLYTHNITFLYIPDGLPLDVPHTADLQQGMTVDACYGRAFEELMQSLVQQDPPVTCIICNTFISHVQDAAKRLGLPFVSFWTQSAASYATSLIVAKGNRPPKDALPSDAVACELLAPGVPQIKYEEFSLLLQSHEPDSFVFKMLTRPFKHIAEADCILMNTSEELEEEAIGFLTEEGHPVVSVGPLLPESFFGEEVSEDGVSWVADEKEQGRSCCPLRWLDKQEVESVIYVSFGSLVSMSEEQIEEIAMGLEASKQAFLWVVRPGLVRSGLFGLPELPEQQATAGAEAELELPKGFLERTAGQGLVIRWAPQLRVLRHKAVGGFLTHCGWNSTLESISAGVPLLGLSFFSDQGLNCRLAVDKWHVALSLVRAKEPANLVLRAELETKVVELMQGASGKALRANAREWRAKAIRSASHTDGSSAINLQHFVDRFKALTT
eukprot:c24919_g1_i1 orf=154-1671(+)